jgi:hypothetical protein
VLWEGCIAIKAPLGYLNWQIAGREPTDKRESRALLQDYAHAGGLSAMSFDEHDDNTPTFLEKQRDHGFRIYIGPAAVVTLRGKENSVSYDVTQPWKLQ